MSSVSSDDHEFWSELGAGHAMSSLDDADEAMYIQHSASCEVCREMERELSYVLADVARATPPIAPPPALKESIMAAVRADDDVAARVIPISGRREVVEPVALTIVGGTAISSAGSSAGSSASLPAQAVSWSSRRVGKMPAWIVGVAAAVVALALVIVWVAPGQKSASIASRCAKVNCPVVTLTGGGHSVAAVMVLDNAAYVDPHGLPPTPTGDVYVLWSLTQGKAPVGIAALHTVPSSGPVRAGSFTMPITEVNGFAITEEHGNSVPAAPSEHLLAQGSRA
jgi:predicted anti-sigma-YlaC factor YlaD